MAKFLRFAVEFLSYNSVSASNDPEDAERLKSSIEEASVSAVSRSNPITVANLATDQAIPLPAATCNYLMICVDQQVSVKVNGGAAQVLKPKTAGKKCPALFLRSDITSLSVSNASGASANLDIILAKI